jgi:hypothetical protein
VRDIMALTINCCHKSELFHSALSVNEKKNGLIRHDARFDGSYRKSIRSLRMSSSPLLLEGCSLQCAGCLYGELVSRTEI